MREILEDKSNWVACAIYYIVKEPSLPDVILFTIVVVILNWFFQKIIKRLVQDKTDKPEE
jgi:Na+/H+ antiporter NhaD/arsenite permease-like protein